MDNRFKTFLKLVFGSMSVIMILLVIRTSLQSNFFEAMHELNTHPWFVTTIVDFYFNIAIISAWTFYREKKISSAILWIIAFVFLGSIATALYVLLQIKSLNKNEPLRNALLRKA